MQFSSNMTLMVLVWGLAFATLHENVRARPVSASGRSLQGTVSVSAQASGDGSNSTVAGSPSTGNSQVSASGSAAALGPGSKVSSAIDLSNNVGDKYANGATTATAEGSTALVQSAGGSFVNDNRQAVNVISSAKALDATLLETTSTYSSSQPPRSPTKARKALLL
ncbi:hypothetical protein ACKKBG_A38480 [Auxenochlorella protothecoides x Auxenochlorella symbiontica]